MTFNKELALREVVKIDQLVLLGAKTPINASGYFYSCILQSVVGEGDEGMGGLKRAQI